MWENLICPLFRFFHQFLTVDASTRAIYLMQKRNKFSMAKL